MNCPSCGAGIGFRTERAPYTVCSSCQTTILRKNLNLAALGKVAECQLDGSPLQLGSGGTFQGRTFLVIGRIQLRYGAGFWNEWFLHYADGSNGWLGEALGQFFISEEVQDARALAAVKDLALGAEVEFEDKDWVVLDRKKVQLSSFEGELPSLIESRDPFLTVDLRNSEGEGLTVDYSNDSVSVFRGHWVPYAALALTGLNRDPDPSIAIPASETAAVKCSSCGAPLEISAPGRSQLLVCQYCDASLDAKSPELRDLGRLFEKASEIAKWAKIPLGTLAQLEDGEYKVIGMMMNSTQVDGVRYTWKDYLLYNHLTGYRWINENNGHHILFEQLYTVPLSFQRKRSGFKWRKRPIGSPPPQFILLNEEKYPHFSRSKVVVDKVVGEFYWRVQSGETSIAYDYVNPPGMISASVTRDDITWTLGRYLDSDALQKIFPTVSFQDEPVGVGPCQPNPFQAAKKQLLQPYLAGFLVAILMIASGLFLPSASDEVIQDQAVVSRSAGQRSTQSTPRSFSLEGKGKRGLTVEVGLGRENSWVKGNARLRSLSSRFNSVQNFQLAEYQGKGSPKHTLVFRGVPAGERLSLEFDGTTGPPRTTPPISGEQSKPEPLTFTLDYKVDVLPPVPNWGGLFYYCLLALIPFIWLDSRRNNFEKKRWYDSDYG